MFGEDFTSIPIVQVSIDGSMSPEKNWALGKAIAQLRLVDFTKARNENKVSTFQLRIRWLIYTDELGFLTGARGF